MDGRWLAVSALAISLTACGGSDKTSSCALVSFRPSSDAGAFHIKATKTSCATARQVAGQARHSSVVGGPFSYGAAGFSCRGTKKSGEVLPSVSWSCTRGDAKVTFSQT